MNFVGIDKYSEVTVEPSVREGRDAIDLEQTREIEATVLGAPPRARSIIVLAQRGAADLLMQQIVSKICKYLHDYTNHPMIQALDIPGPIDSS